MFKVPIYGLLLIVFQAHGRVKGLYIDEFDMFNVNPYPFCGHSFTSDDPYDEYKWRKRRLRQQQKRVVGGEESQPASWPWQVALYFNGTQVCAGSLINSDWIVTAAHCFHDSYSSTNPKHWTATLGEHNVKDKEVFEQVRNIKHVILHPKYNFPFFQGILDTPPDYDIAVIRLSRPARITSNVYPICLLHYCQTVKPGKTCYLTGWGHTRFNGTKPPALREAQVKIVSLDTCNKPLSYGGKIHQRAMCAGYEEGGVDACQYDSGGPLSCEEHGQYFLTGVVSWGHECARPHKYGVYSNMSVLTPWVVKTVAKFEDKHHLYRSHHRYPYLHQRPYHGSYPYPF